MGIAPERSRVPIAALSEQCPPASVSIDEHFLAILWYWTNRNRNRTEQKNPPYPINLLFLE